MTEPLTLFDIEGQPKPEPAPKESPAVRRTKRQAALLARGRHPLTAFLGRSLFLHDEAAPADDKSAAGRRCGNCRFREVINAGHARSYPKCMFSGAFGRPLRASNSDATDVRAWWPGCTDHEWGDPKISRDAARWVP